MSETMQPRNGDERRDRIMDIRERKGHLLGRGIIVSSGNPGFVPAIPPEEPLKYSTPYIDKDGKPAYKYRGKPTSSIRTLPADQSEFVRTRNRHSAEGCGRTALSTAVERQQIMIAEDLAYEQQTSEEARANRLNRYLELLGDGTALLDEAAVDELNGLAHEFHMPRDYIEACQIMDAGGVSYGIC